LLCLVLAVVANVAQYEIFLFLIGSFFVPLFGILAADYFVARRRYDYQELYREGGAYWYRDGVHWAGVVAWAAGFLVYQWVVPTAIPGWQSGLGMVFRWLHLPFPLSGVLPWLGASIPSFIVALVLYSLVRRGR
jgi:cytosine/uracil/thiamine/allantoin permease